VPLPIDAIVLKALSKNPENRYQSAGEMRADLLRAAAGRPVTATPVQLDHEDGLAREHTRSLEEIERRLTEIVRSVGRRIGSGGRRLDTGGRLPERTGSAAVLIGTSRHADPALDILAVEHNVADLALRLSDSEYGGFDSEQTHVLHNPDRMVSGQLAEIAEQTIDTLFVYYAGHGVVSPDGRLYLVLPQTQMGREVYTALPYDELRYAVIESPARNKVVILDCCFAGRAIDLLSPAAETAMGQVDVTGSYVITATSATRPAHAPDGERYSCFTGELIEYLRLGSRDSGSLLRLDDTYRHLRQRLSRRGLPLPQQRGTDTAGHLALARNPSWRA
jgi:ATP-dependent Clp protease ATP-binding subunit ClpC